MDMFEYIATAEPGACQQLCQQYGYDVQAEDTSDLGDCMSQLVQAEGEPALHDLVALHPDRDLILEQLGPTVAMLSPGASKGCGCASCQAAASAKPATDHLLQMTQSGHHITQTHQAGLFIIGGLLVLTLAIISTNKSS